MSGLWVSRSEVDAERKRRRVAEDRLDELLKFLDPQPETKGGPIYAGPFQQSGDLARRVLGIVEKWEREAAQLGEGVLCPDLGEFLTNLARELRKTIGAYSRPESQTKGGIIFPETNEPERCPKCRQIKGVGQKFKAAYDSGRMTGVQCLEPCELCGEPRFGVSGVSDDH
jgi:hypothetical protein